MTSMGFRSRTDDSRWPHPWTRHQQWPKPLSEEHWIPPPNRSVTACVRTNGVKTEPWPDPAAALDHLRELGDARCSKGCEGRHLMLWTDATSQAHTRFLVPPPLPLADQFLACGYRVSGVRLKDRWDTYTRYQARDEDLDRTTTKVTQIESPPKEIAVTEQPEFTDEDAAEIIAAERRAGTLLARMGLNRRAALAHREVADLLASGAPEDEVEAAAAVAQALTDAALADLDAAG